MLSTGSGVIIRMLASEISKMSRNTLGVTLIKLDEKDLLVSLAVVIEDDD